MTAAEHQQSVEEAMQQEIEEIIEEAQKRPITKDEAAALRFHCGV